jgi:hypothetical protein
LRPLDFLRELVDLRLELRELELRDDFFLVAMFTSVCM